MKFSEVFIKNMFPEPKSPQIFLHNTTDKAYILAV